MTDYAARRTMMVDTQVRPSDVTKFPIIRAMLAVARERFVPPALMDAAYMGENIDLGGGRVMLDPRTLAKMLDAVDVQPGDRVLDLGTGYGYAAAVVALIAGSVVALEDDAGRAAAAGAALGALPGAVPGDAAAAVTMVTGPLEAGAPQHGPYDVILVQGGVEHVPPVLTDQLAEGGRIACLFMEGALGICRVGHQIDGQVAWRPAFNATAPVLPGFARARVFAL